MTLTSDPANSTPPRSWPSPEFAGSGAQPLGRRRMPRWLGVLGRPWLHVPCGYRAGTSSTSYHGDVSAVGTLFCVVLARFGYHVGGARHRHTGSSWPGPACGAGVGRGWRDRASGGRSGRHSLGRTTCRDAAWWCAWPRGRAAVKLPALRLGVPPCLSRRRDELRLSLSRSTCLGIVWIFQAATFPGGCCRGFTATENDRTPRCPS